MSTGARRWDERFKENKCTVIRESSCFRNEGAAFWIKGGGGRSNSMDMSNLSELVKQLQTIVGPISGAIAVIISVAHFITVENTKVLFLDEKERARRYIVFAIVITITVFFANNIVGEVIVNPPTKTGIEIKSAIDVINQALKNNDTVNQKYRVEIWKKFTEYTTITTAILIIIVGIIGIYFYWKFSTRSVLKREMAVVIFVAVSFELIFVIIIAFHFALNQLNLKIYLASKFAFAVISSIVITSKIYGQEKEMQLCFEDENHIQYYYYIRKGEYCLCGTKKEISESGNVIKFYPWQEFLDNKIGVQVIINKQMIRQMQQMLKLSRSLLKLLEDAKKAHEELNQEQKDKIRQLLNEIWELANQMGGISSTKKKQIKIAVSETQKAMESTENQGNQGQENPEDQEQKLEEQRKRVENLIKKLERWINAQDT